MNTTLYHAQNFLGFVFVGYLIYNLIWRTNNA